MSTKNLLKMRLCQGNAYIAPPHCQEQGPKTPLGQGPQALTRTFQGHLPQTHQNTMEQQHDKIMAQPHDQSECDILPTFCGTESCQIRCRPCFVLIAVFVAFFSHIWFHVLQPFIVSIRFLVMFPFPLC